MHRAKTAKQQWGSEVTPQFGIHCTELSLFHSSGAQNLGIAYRFLEIVHSLHYYYYYYYYYLHLPFLFTATCKTSLRLLIICARRRYLKDSHYFLDTNSALIRYSFSQFIYVFSGFKFLFEYFVFVAVFLLLPYCFFVCCSVLFFVLVLLYLCCIGFTNGTGAIKPCR